jgi:hypothetical protein
VQTKQDKQDRTGRKGLPGQDLTARKGQAGQDSQNRTGGTRLPLQGYQDMSQDRAARIGLPAQDCKNKTTRCRTVRRRQPEKDRHARQQAQDSQNGAARI